MKKHIILFDGECNFCSFWVKYVIKRDKKDVFRFASLQSDIGKKFLKNYGISNDLDSVVLIKNNQYYIKSIAAFRILKMLGGFPSIFYFLIIIPAFIRNLFYDLMAGTRYKIFKRKTCELPQHKNYASKFL